MVHKLNVCVDQKTDKNTGGCCEKEKVITAKVATMYKSQYYI